MTRGKRDLNRARAQVSFFLNGTLTHVSGDDAFMTLAEWLRKRAMLTGTKIVCAEGDCGACTVLRAFAPPGIASKRKPTFIAVNSCVITVAQMDGSHLVTVEGLKVDGELAPAQTAMRACHGSQCGYCTPGFVMALTGVIEKYAVIDRKTAANALTGNLCRCTGYSPILDAAEAMEPSAKHQLAGRYLTAANIKKLRDNTKGNLLIVDSEARIFKAPDNLADACRFMAQSSSPRIIGAATDIGVQINKGKPLGMYNLSLQNIADLYGVHIGRSSIYIGARVTLSDVREIMKKPIPEFAKFLDLFASPQIKNAATLVGNIANASPIGDTLPFLLATDSVIHTERLVGRKLTHRAIPATEFFLGYKNLALKPGEIITFVEIPRGKSAKNLRLYKVSQRKDLDISAVSAALMINTAKSGDIESASIALGGVAATPVRLPKIERFLIGKRPTSEHITAATQMLNDQLTPLSDARGSDSFRRALVHNIFNQYVHDVFGSPA